MQLARIYLILEYWIVQDFSACYGALISQHLFRQLCLTFTTYHLSQYYNNRLVEVLFSLYMYMYK